ncbi:hypothetical protein [Paenibacillus amylolyticus]
MQKLRSVVKKWSSVQASLMFGGVGGLYKGIGTYRRVMTKLTVRSLT